MTGVAPSVLNTIPAQQNTSQVLDFQVAAQVLYRRAERLFYIQLLVGVVVPVAFAVVNLVLAKSTLGASWDRASIAAWGALYGVVIMLLDELVLDQKQKQWKRTAAIAQEMFDTVLFDLSWRRTKAGAKLDIADIHKWAARRRRVDPSLSTIRDWYPSAVGGVPLHVARVICQRANLWWDSRLRESYASYLGGFAIVIAVVVIVGAVYLGLSAAELLVAASTLAPAFRWAMREQRRQKSAATATESLCRRGRELYEEIISDRIDAAEASRLSRDLQDDIFDHRQSVPIGHSWLHRLYRPEFEPAMQADAEQSVREYLVRRIGVPLK